MASAIPDEPEDKQENEQAAKAARWSEYLWQIMPKIEIDPADIQVIKSPAGHDVWVHSPRPVDKKKDTAEQKLSRPRNLEELFLQVEVHPRGERGDDAPEVRLAGK